MPRTRINQLSAKDLLQMIGDQIGVPYPINYVRSTADMIAENPAEWEEFHKQLAREKLSPSAEEAIQDVQQALRAPELPQSRRVDKIQAALQTLAQEIK